MLTAVTTMVTGAIRAIEEYLVVDSSDCPVRRATVEETTSSHLGQLVLTLMARSDVLAKVFARLELALKETPTCTTVQRVVETIKVTDCTNTGCKATSVLLYVWMATHEEGVT